MEVKLLSQQFGSNSAPCPTPLGICLLQYYRAFLKSLSIMFIIIPTVHYSYIVFVVVIIVVIVVGVIVVGVVVVVVIITGGIGLDGLSKEKVRVPQAQVTEGLSSSVFEIIAPATIPSDSSSHKVLEIVHSACTIIVYMYVQWNPSKKDTIPDGWMYMYNKYIRHCVVTIVYIL